MWVVFGGTAAAYRSLSLRKSQVALVIVLIRGALLRRGAHIDVPHALRVHGATENSLLLGNTRSLRKYVDDAQPRVLDARVCRNAGRNRNVSIAVGVVSTIEPNTQRLLLRPRVLHPIQCLRGKSLDVVFKYQVARLLRCFQQITSDVRCRDEVDKVLLPGFRSEAVRDW